jgi:4-diphosphocytidyl-2-C-methyl-D-erythritol kinase
MSSSKTLLCPAKINLGLLVAFKRPDGYHEIESLFLPVDFCDELTVRPSASLHLRTENLIETVTASDFEAVSERGNPEKNLLIRIMEAVNRNRAQPLHFELFLRKRIPSGAGLGGGSSNAGTLLRHLVKGGWLDMHQAFDLARRLGADIPFFLDPRPSSVTGIGDVIEPLSEEEDHPRLKAIRGVLVLSDIVVPTKNAYSELKRPLQQGLPAKAGSGPGRAYQALLEGDAKALSQFSNDFEEVVFRLHPELAGVKKALLDCGAFYASMSGSGSAVFGLYDEADREAERLACLRQKLPGYQAVPFGLFL